MKFVLDEDNEMSVQIVINGHLCRHKLPQDYFLNYSPSQQKECLNLIVNTMHLSVLISSSMRCTS